MIELIIALLGSSLLASILTGLLAPLVTGWYKIRKDKEFRKFQQKEERFFSLLTDVVAFTVGAEDVTQKEKFLQAYRQIWLYASDEAIKSINNFFRSVGAHFRKWEELGEAYKRHNQMILQLRKDFYGKTKLNPEDFLIVTVAKAKS